MSLIAEHVEPDTRERILVVAERLFRQLGYQKTTVADIAKELRMSPANVYRFFDSKKAIHEGVARSLMSEVEVEAQRIADAPGPAAPGLAVPVPSAPTSVIIADPPAMRATSVRHRPRQR